MTHSGGKPHQVGYRGQDYVVTVWDDEQQKRIVLGWRTQPMKWADIRRLETKPSWQDARCEPVADHKTGEPPR